MNETGIYPIEYKVLIKVEEVEDRSAGGIFLPDNARDREQEAKDRGKLIAVGDLAFSGMGAAPVVGDTVLFNKYAGSLIQVRGEDRNLKKYRLCNDKDIGAIVREET